MDAAAQLEALLDLEARHDELLEKLDALDRRVETVLAECLRGRPEAENAAGRGAHAAAASRASPSPSSLASTSADRGGPTC